MGLKFVLGHRHVTLFEVQFGQKIIEMTIILVIPSHLYSIGLNLGLFKPILSIFSKYKTVPVVSDQLYSIHIFVIQLLFFQFFYSTTHR